MTDAERLLGMPLTSVAANGLFAMTEPSVPERIEDQTILDAPLAGISLIAEDNLTVSAVHLYAEGHEGYRQFDGDLPGGISFRDTPEIARAALGPPVRSMAARSVPILGVVPASDVFVHGATRISVQYNSQESAIELITLTSP